MLTHDPLEVISQNDDAGYLRRSFDYPSNPTGFRAALSPAQGTGKMIRCHSSPHLIRVAYGVNTPANLCPGPAAGSGGFKTT